METKYLETQSSPSTEVITVASAVLVTVVLLVAVMVMLKVLVMVKWLRERFTVSQDPIYEEVVFDQSFVGWAGKKIPPHQNEDYGYLTPQTLLGMSNKIIME